MARGHFQCPYTVYNIIMKRKTNEKQADDLKFEIHLKLFMFSTVNKYRFDVT